jgi:CubicO group peptidase (beta-lactamase class C family)
MLLDHGEFEGVEILEHGTVDAMFANHLGTLDFPPAIRSADPTTSADFDVGPGHKWGLGLLLNMEQRPGMRAIRSGGWAGIFNTHFWVDHHSGVTGAIYCQTLPFAEPAVMRVCESFERALYESLP